MLESISIKDIALIDEAEIVFGEGFNVLSGETGAGKSMIIDSLNFALGEKAQKDMIRTGAESARVEAVFFVGEDAAAEAIAAAGIALDEERLLVIHRTIGRSGKATARVNGQTVTASMLRQIAGALIDIHGQHEHQSLLSAAKQLALIDDFCGEAVSEIKARLGEEYRAYRQKKKQAEEMVAEAENKDVRLDFLRFQIQELESAQLAVGEEEQLEEEKTIVAAAERLAAATQTALCALYDGDGKGGTAAIDNVHQALAAIETAGGHDKRLLPLVERISDAVAELEDVTREIRRYSQSIDADPARLDEIQERMSEIYRTKKKYGGTVETALAALEKAKEERDFLENASFELEQMDKALRRQEARVLACCEDLSKRRHEYGKKMETRITEVLWDLGMENARFSVAFERAGIGGNGFDKAELLLSANKGEGLKPLARIASGGEMSRVMLAIKSVAAVADAVETYIFDEIDTGVSGRTAQKVAEKLANIAGTRQILCITHLPQIAAMADTHILIEKTERSGKTLTKTRTLDETAVVEELSRLLGGAKITAQTRAAAAEMREMARETKTKLAAGSGK